MKWSEEQSASITQGLGNVIQNESIFVTQYSYARALLESLATTLKSNQVFVYTSRAERYYDSQNPDRVENRRGTTYAGGKRSIRAMVTEELALRKPANIPKHGSEPVACVNKGVTVFQEQIKKIPDDNNASENLKFVVAWYNCDGAIESANIKDVEFFPGEVDDRMGLLNVIKYGPPGTGKTYSLVKDVLGIAKYDLLENSSIHKIICYGELKNKFKQVEFITFHQSYSYEEFVEGIRAEVVNGQVAYKIRNGIFKRLCRRAYFYKVKSLVNSEQEGLFSSNAQAIYEKFPFELLRKHDPELSNLLLDYESKEVTEAQKENIPKFVLCIDEINRANISRVFGELITLIEDTKRQGAKETISVTLPYSGEEFFVPDNLYIRGTMNTADRSLAKLDLALRRRFHFEAYYPVLKEVKNDTARAILENLNKFITEQLEREHAIGHSYLMNIEKEVEEESLHASLTEAFEGKIIPLLEEYFLHEPTKVKAAITAANLPDPVLEKLKNAYAD